MSVSVSAVPPPVPPAGAGAGADMSLTRATQCCSPVSYDVTAPGSCSRGRDRGGGAHGGWLVVTHLHKVCIRTCRCSQWGGIIRYDLKENGTMRISTYKTYLQSRWGEYMHALLIIAFPDHGGRLVNATLAPAVEAKTIQVALCGARTCKYGEWECGSVGVREV